MKNGVYGGGILIIIFYGRDLSILCRVFSIVTEKIENSSLKLLSKNSGVRDRVCYFTQETFKTSSHFLCIWKSERSFFCWELVLGK